MGEPIYTDKDYLDNQFATLHARLDAFASLPSDVAVLNDWRITHDRSHNRARKVSISIAGLVLAAAGILTRLTF